MYGQKKNFSTFSYKLVQISPIMILVHSGAFLSISSWFCTGSPHIRLEQTNFIGRVLCRLLRARNARSVSARSGTEITKSLGACSEI